MNNLLYWIIVSIKYLLNGNWIFKDNFQGSSFWFWSSIINTISISCEEFAVHLKGIFFLFFEYLRRMKSVNLLSSPMGKFSFQIEWYVKKILFSTSKAITNILQIRRKSLEILTKFALTLVPCGLTYSALLSRVLKQ